MPKRKHVKKQPVVACADANERTRKSIAERKRVAEAMQKRYEKFMQEYEEEMKRRKESEEGKVGYLKSPDIVPEPYVSDKGDSAEGTIGPIVSPVEEETE